MSNNHYDVLAASVRPKDLTSSAENRALLHRIRNNDPALTSLSLDDEERYDSFLLREGDDLSWLGYFIGRNEKLKRLNIYYLPSCGDQVENFFIGMKSNKSIKSIGFWGVRGFLSLNEGISAINLAHVTTLDMQCDLGEQAHNFAVGLHSCKSLGTYCGPVTAETVASLTALPMLENVGVRIEGPVIRRDECMALRALLGSATKMKRLEICEAGLGNDGLELLAEGLACDASLTHGELDLSSNNIGNEGLQALALSLASNTKLQKLYLGDNNIGDTGLEKLADSLAHNRALHVLSIARNTAITVAGIEAISRILQSRESGLEDLRLDGINISDEGGKTLASALSINKSLVKLSLRCGQNGISIGDVGLRALALGLSSNSHLNTLELSGNTAITASGLRSFKEYFRSPSCALKRLNLLGINIGDAGAHALADALDQNNSLKDLYFGDRGITGKGWERFLKLVCDSSSPHSIQLSNHTLCDLGGYFFNLGGYFFNLSGIDVKHCIAGWLRINNVCQTPNLAAKSKILHQFPDLDMAPLLQWNLTLLPLVKHWFDTFTFSSPNDELEASIQNRKLAAVYQFVRGLSVLVVDRLRAAEIGALEEEERRLLQV